MDCVSEGLCAQSRQRLHSNHRLFSFSCSPSASSSLLAVAFGFPL
uniref:Uncharacterized protein n=1 Tax=Anguilla anguilla TaxID=7936 RepID=A0A0E9UD03_ANGAN